MGNFGCLKSQHFCYLQRDCNMIQCLNNKHIKQTPNNCTSELYLISFQPSNNLWECTHLSSKITLDECQRSSPVRSENICSYCGRGVGFVAWLVFVPFFFFVSWFYLISEGAMWCPAAFICCWWYLVLVFFSLSYAHEKLWFCVAIMPVESFVMTLGQILFSDRWWCGYCFSLGMGQTTQMAY